MTYTITELQVIEQAKRISKLEAARIRSPLYSPSSDDQNRGGKA